MSMLKEIFLDNFMHEKDACICLYNQEKEKAKIFVKNGFIVHASWQADFESYCAKNIIQSYESGKLKNILLTNESPKFYTMENGSWEYFLQDYFQEDKKDVKRPWFPRKNKKSRSLENCEEFICINDDYIILEEKKCEGPESRIDLLNFLRQKSDLIKKEMNLGELNSMSIEGKKECVFSRSEDKSSICIKSKK